MKNETDIQITIDCVRKSLTSTSWWSFVQEEIKEQLNYLLEHINTIGVPFKNAFLSAFRYEYSLRYMKGTANNLTKPGALFGKYMTEECYQSGIIPVKMLLHLDDWTVPNDADVQVCMQFLQQVDLLEELGLFDLDKELTKSQIIKAINKATPPIRLRKHSNILIDILKSGKKED